MHEDRNHVSSWPLHLELWRYARFGVAGRLESGVRLSFRLDNRWIGEPEMHGPFCLNNDTFILPLYWNSVNDAVKRAK